MNRLLCWLGLCRRALWQWVVDYEGERPLERYVKFCEHCGQVSGLRAVQERVEDGQT